MKYIYLSGTVYSCKECNSEEETFKTSLHSGTKYIKLERINEKLKLLEELCMKNEKTSSRRPW